MLKRNALIEEFSLDEIYARDEGICLLCGLDVLRKNATMDHVVPLSKGGLHQRDSVVLAHRTCNTRKYDKSLEEYLARWPRKRELSDALAARILLASNS